MGIANVALTDTFDQFRLRTNQLILYANELDAKSNTIFDTLNVSYDTANNAYDVTNNTFDAVNANAAVLVTVYNLHNANAAILTSCYTTANAGYILGNSSYDLLNVAFNTGNVCYSTLNSAYDTTNSAFSLANTLYDIANNTTGNTTQIFVDVSDLQTLAYGAYNVTNAAFNKTNSNFTVTNAAYTMANANYIVTNAAFTKTNANYTTTNAAFDKANNALPNTSGAVFAGDLTITGNLGFGTAASAGLRLNLAGDMKATGNVELGQGTNNIIIFNGSRLRLSNTVTVGGATSNTLYIDPVSSQVAIGNTNPPAGINLFVQTANVVSSLWAGGYNVAPTLAVVTVNANGAYNLANAAYNSVNSAFSVVNAAFAQANTDNARLTVAFTRANTAVPNTGGVMTGDLTVYRGGSPTTGYVFINQANTRYLGFDGSNYQLPGASLYVNGSLVWTQGNDGAGSGLDADTVDGYNPATAATGSTLALRDASGHLTVNYMFSSYVNMSHAASNRTGDTVFYSSTDDYIRKNDAAGMRASLDVPTRTGGDASGNWNINSKNITDYTINQNLGTSNSPTFDYIYCNRFVDRGDNNYYADPAGTSVFNDLRCNILYRADNTGYYVFGNNSGDARLRNIYCDFLGSYGNITAYYSSDINLKTNIKPIENAIDKVKSISGVTFDWSDDYINKLGGEDGYFVRKNDVGVIAQEIEKVLPQIVATKDDGTKAVKYERLVALLIEAVKEQQVQIEDLQKKVGK